MTLATAEQVAAVLAERDAVQANLLELDGGFVRRMLDGAALSGRTRPRWETAAATLAGLWETYLAYSAVVDRVAVLGSGERRPAKKDLPELNDLLSRPCVRLPVASAPPAHKDLTATGQRAVTLAAAVASMRLWFREVTDVTSAVETVWAAAGVPLDAAEHALAGVRPLVAGLGTETETAFREAQTALDSLRAAVHADPLALLPAAADRLAAGDRPGTGGGPVDTSAADRLREQVTALAGRITDLDRLRRQARSRIDALPAAADRARAERAEATAAWQRAAARVAPLPPLPPEVPEPMAASLSTLAAHGQWSRLGAELDRCEAELAGSAAATARLRQAATAAVGRRDELRGLLGAYKAKAARLGGAEDADLSARYESAYNLLWTAPCDLTAAQLAVSGYQRAVLALEGRR